MRVRALLVAIAVCGPALAGCGGRTARDPAVTRTALRATAAAPARLSTAPGSCAVVVDRTLRAVAARIEARAALRRGRVNRTPALVKTLTRPAPTVCAATASRTVADTVGAVGQRLVRAETT